MQGFAFEVIKCPITMLKVRFVWPTWSWWVWKLTTRMAVLTSKPKLGTETWEDHDFKAPWAIWQDPLIHKKAVFVWWPTWFNKGHSCGHECGAGHRNVTPQSCITEGSDFLFSSRPLPTHTTASLVGRRGVVGVEGKRVEGMSVTCMDGFYVTPIRIK